MKSKTSQLVTLALMPLTMIMFSSCSTAPVPPPSPEAASEVVYEEGVPGGIIVDTLEVSARVTAIDSETREVTLLGPDENEYEVTVGPGVINFDQIKVGDLVKATLTEELVIFVGDQASAQYDGAALIVAGAAEGEQPAGQVAEIVQVTGTVTDIDMVNRTASLKFEDGTIKVFPVRDDIDLSQHQAGEQVVFQHTEMIAISVAKP